MNGKKFAAVLGIIAAGALIGAAACRVSSGGDGGGHKHSWGEWQYDADEHYRECEAGDAVQREAHDFIDGECRVCGYHENGHVHVWTAWEHDTEWHWRECEDGDAEQRERHKFVDGLCKCGYVENSIPGLTFKDNGEGYTVSTDKTFDMSRVEIPSKYLGKPVTQISGFTSLENLTSVTLPSSLKVINASAFSRCKNLTSIRVPEGVTTIGRSAFDYCTNLSSVTFPSTLTSVGDCLMSTAYANNDANYYNDVLYVGQYCISPKILPYGTQYSSPLNIKSGTTLIADGAFQSKAIKSVVLPDSVKYIGESAFNASQLTDINIPSGLIKMADNAFAGCKSLATITGGSSVYSVADNCVMQKADDRLLVVGCNNIEVPESVKIIGTYAFKNLSGKEFILPAGVKKIEDDAFAGSYPGDKRTIYFKGNESQFGNIEVGTGQTLDVYYYSAGEPPKNQEQTAYEGKWWKYGDGGKPEKWVLAA